MRENRHIGAGIGFGLASGVLVGSVMGNVGAGLGFGLAVGVVAGWLVARRGRL